jgi:hypothetical protein
MDMIPPSVLTSNETPIEFSLAGNLQLHRKCMQSTVVVGLGKPWTIAERFDARFDTEVGGQIMVAPQPVTATSQAPSAFSAAMDDFTQLSTQDRSAAIIDYDNNGCAYSLEAAEALGVEFAPVVARLRERIGAYQQLEATACPQ